MLGYLKGREARPAGLGRNLLKTLGQLVVFWTAFLLVLPAGVLALEDALGLADHRFGTPATLWAGASIFALAGSLGVLSAAVMAPRGRGTPLPADCPRELVVAGPYRFVRNPMAVAGIAQGVAVGLALGSPAVVAYALCGGPAWHILVRPWEELDLERRFGEPYRCYRRAVRCWVPRLRPYRPEAPGR